MRASGLHTMLLMLCVLAGCQPAKGISSRSAQNAKPGSDPLCQVDETGGGLRPGVSTFVTMRVGNDRSCTWGVNARNFNGISVAAEPSHGTLRVAESNGVMIYEYKSAANYVGGDSFAFTLRRGDGYDNRVDVGVTVVAPTTQL